jgi:hypothetical protein
VIASTISVDRLVRSKKGAPEDTGSFRRPLSFSNFVFAAVGMTQGKS